MRLARLGRDANELLAGAAVLGLECDARDAGRHRGPRARGRRGRPRRGAAGAAAAPGGGRAALRVRPRARARGGVRRAQRPAPRAAAPPGRRGADGARARSAHLEEIATHLFEAAGTADARLAADALTRAGRRALERLAYEDAAERFARALEALELAGAEDDAGPVLLARGDALLRAGEPAAAREAFTAAARLARRRGDAELLAEAALGFAGLGIAIVDVDARVVARLEEALGASPRTPCCARACRPGSRSSSTTPPDRARSETLSAAGGRRRARGRRPERAGRRAERAPRRAVAARPARRAAAPSPPR